MDLTTELTKTLTNLLKSNLPNEATLTDIEQTTKVLLQKVGQGIIGQLLTEMNPTYPEPTTSCQCGMSAQYRYQRKGHFHTLLGEVIIKRGYYVCSDCHTGCYPLDKQLGLRPNQLSAELSRLVAMTGVELPFMAGRNLFEALTLVSISDQAMAKATQAVGKRVVESETQRNQNGLNEQYLLHKKREQKHPVRLYGSLDATKVHIRDDKEHRWRDLKIGAWYEAAGVPPATPDGKWSIQAQNIHYFADICTAQDFSPLVWGYGVEKNAHLAHELIFVCDGAEWIWNIVDEHYPQAIQILDWFHASEYLLPVAKAISKELKQQSEWISMMKEMLWQGDIEAILEKLDTLRQTLSADVIRITANYYERHKERMRYAEFRKQGYQIGSGTIESAAKQIGMMRLKVPGAIWNESSARYVAKARAAFLSDQWESLPLAM